MLERSHEFRCFKDCFVRSCIQPGDSSPEPENVEPVRRQIDTIDVSDLEFAKIRVLQARVQKENCRGSLIS